MKKLLKILGIGVGALVAVVLCVVGYFVASWPPTFPDHEKPAITASDDPAVIARGAYLVNAVAHCGACHSDTDTYLSSTPGAPQDLSGGHEWHMGPMGVIRSANITQDEATGVGSWTDAELARAIRHGVGKDGRALLFMMAVGYMPDDDLTAVVSYLRTVTPVSKEVAPSEVSVMGKVLLQTAVSFFAEPHNYRDQTPPHVPAGGVSLERGRYLAEGPAFCAGCHSNGEIVGGKLIYDGPPGAGRDMEPFPDEDDPAFEYAAPNLSSHPDTGHLVGWDEGRFVARMAGGRMFRTSAMPWETYREMTAEDLKSLWLWTQAIPPTARNVGPTRREAGWKPPTAN